MASYEKAFRSLSGVPEAASAAKSEPMEDDDDCDLFGSDSEVSNWKNVTL